jgi:8-amino-7-oxononanoate synthase
MPDAHELHRRVSAVLERRRQNSTLRSLDPPSYNYNNTSNLIDFSSNDYLSLSRSSSLNASLLQALSKCDNPLYGPASSRLLDGNSTLHLNLEHLLSQFYKGPSALLFNSGFDANVGIFSCLPSENDAIVYDELIHASCHDGMRHSRTKLRKSFKHNDPTSLRSILKSLKATSSPGFEDGTNQIYVAVESLYSMDGDIAPLATFLDIIEQEYPLGNCHLILDEAHTTGLCGPQGRGLACALEVQDRILIRLHTFGKAMSCGGGGCLTGLVSYSC